MSLAELPAPSPLTDAALVAACLDALATDPAVFVHHRRLVEVVLQPQPQVQPLDRGRLRERLSENAAWQSFLHEHQLRTPGWMLSNVLRRPQWPRQRTLAGLITTPVLRPDGSLLDVLGYDDATRLFYAPSRRFQIPDAPTLDDARAALATLKEHTKIFPFESPAHHSAFLASLLTPFARPAIQGAAPLFFFDAPDGAVPHLLADTVSTLVGGRPITQMEKPPSEREFRRTLARIALPHDGVMLLDGAESYRSNSALLTALFQRRWADGDARAEEPRALTWYSAGSNVLLSREVAELVLPVRLRAVEDQFEGPLWTAPADLQQRFEAARPALVAAALTLLRAFVVAGQPKQELKSWPTFESWTDLVAASLVWAGAENPLQSREVAQDAIDDTRADLQRFLFGFALLHFGRTGLTVRELLQRLEVEDEHTTVCRRALDVLLPGTWHLPRMLGAFFKKHRGVRLKGYVIYRAAYDRDGFVRWAFRRADSAEQAEAADCFHEEGRDLPDAESSESLHENPRSVIAPPMPAPAHDVWTDPPARPRPPDVHQVPAPPPTEPRLIDRCVIVRSNRRW